jgi:hypothetical protein
MRIDHVEAQIEKVVAGRDLDPGLLKMLIGLCDGMPLHGAELIERWRAAAAYSEELQRAMIEKHWQFFPWWYYEERLDARDATLWRHDVLVQSAYNLVTIVAALEIAPPGFAERLPALLTQKSRAATAELEELVRETWALVGERFPEIDLAIEWGSRPTPPGARETPWA